MTIEQLKGLPRGAIIRHVGTGDSHVVTGHAGVFPIVTRTQVIHNAPEWRMVVPGAPGGGR